MAARISTNSSAAANGASSSWFLVYLNDMGAPGAAARIKKAFAKSNGKGKTLTNARPSKGTRMRLAARARKSSPLSRSKVRSCRQVTSNPNDMVMHTRNAIAKDFDNGPTIECISRAHFIARSYEVLRHPRACSRQQWSMKVDLNSLGRRGVSMGNELFHFSALVNCEQHIRRQHQRTKCQNPDVNGRSRKAT